MDENNDYRTQSAQSLVASSKPLTAEEFRLFLADDRRGAVFIEPQVEWFETVKDMDGVARNLPINLYTWAQRLVPSGVRVFSQYIMNGWARYVQIGWTSSIAPGPHSRTIREEYLKVEFLFGEGRVWQFQDNRAVLRNLSDKATIEEWMRYNRDGSFVWENTKLVRMRKNTQARFLCPAGVHNVLPSMCHILQETLEILVKRYTYLPPSFKAYYNHNFYAIFNRMVKEQLGHDSKLGPDDVLYARPADTPDWVAKEFHQAVRTLGTLKSPSGLMSNPDSLESSAADAGLTMDAYLALIINEAMFDLVKVLTYRDDEPANEYTQRIHFTRQRPATMINPRE